MSQPPAFQVRHRTRASQRGTETGPETGRKALLELEAASSGGRQLGTKEKEVQEVGNGRGFSITGRCRFAMRVLLLFEKQNHFAAARRHGLPRAHGRGPGTTTGHPDVALEQDNKKKKQKAKGFRV